jgi:arylsulfatase A-like enzyme
MAPDQNRTPFLQKHPLFLHISLAGLIWAVPGLLGGIRFLWSNGIYLSESKWFKDLYLFASTRDLFNLPQTWMPAAADRVLVPGLYDWAWFLGVQLVLASVFAVVSGFSGWLSGLLASTFRRDWNGVAWCFGFQSGALALALLIRAYLDLFFSLSLFLKISASLLLLTSLTLLFDRAGRSIFKKESLGRLGRNTATITSLPFIIAAFFAHSVLYASPISEIYQLPEASDPARRGRVKGVLLLTVDTLRYDHTSMGRYRIDTTPWLSSLAAEGVIFDQCHSPAPWTLPSMASLITGLSPLVHGAEVKELKMPSGAVALPQILQRHGYRTSAFYTHIFVSSKYGFDRGYDDYEEFDIVKSFAEGNQPIAEEVMERVFSWLDENYQRPFFLAVHLFDPHWDYAPPPPYDSLYDPDYQGGFSGTIGDINPFIHGFIQINPRDLQHLTALYDGEVRYTDDQITRLFAKLKELGVYDEMLIVVSADHGEEFKDHGRLSHGYSVYQESIRIPLIVRFPGFFKTPYSPGARVSVPVTLTDIPPTILEVLGIPPFEGFEGSSLLGLDPSEDASRALLSRTALQGRYYMVSIIKEGMKYIQAYGPEEKSQELYDLALDPREKNNLAPTKVGLARKLRRDMYRMIRKQRSRRFVHAGDEDSVIFDKKTMERLRALGYVD